MPELGAVQERRGAARGLEGVIGHEHHVGGRRECGFLRQRLVAREAAHGVAPARELDDGRRRGVRTAGERRPAPDVQDEQHAWAVLGRRHAFTGACDLGLDLGRERVRRGLAIKRATDGRDLGEQAVDAGVVRHDRDRHSRGAELLQHHGRTARRARQDEVGLERHDRFGGEPSEVAEVGKVRRRRWVVARAVDGDETLARTERVDDLGDVAAERDQALRAQGRSDEKPRQERRRRHQSPDPKRHGGYPPV